MIEGSVSSSKATRQIFEASVENSKVIAEFVKRVGGGCIRRSAFCCGKKVHLENRDDGTKCDANTT